MEKSDREFLQVVFMMCRRVSFQHVLPNLEARTTNSSSLTIRNRQEDELEEFNKRVTLDFDCLESHLASESFFHPVVWYKVFNKLCIQSCTFFTNSIPLFVIQLSKDFKYEGFHADVKCTTAMLSKKKKNQSTTLDLISKLNEAIRYLSLLAIDKKKVVIKDHIDVMGSHKIGEKSYTAETIIRAFNYHATSRETFDKLRQDYKLPSIRTLMRLTSRVSKTNNKKFHKKHLRKFGWRASKVHDSC